MVCMQSDTACMGQGRKIYYMPAQAFTFWEHCAASLHLCLSGKEQGLSNVTAVSLEGALHGWSPGLCRPSPSCPTLSLLADLLPDSAQHG